MLLGGRRGAAGGGRKLGGSTCKCVLTTHPLPLASLSLSVRLAAAPRTFVTAASETTPLRTHRREERAVNPHPILTRLLPHFRPARLVGWSICLAPGERVILETTPPPQTHLSPPPQAGRLTGLHGCGIGRRAGRPSARPVVGPNGHVVLGVGVQISDTGSGVQPCRPHTVSGCFFVPSFPVADLKGPGYPRFSSQCRAPPTPALAPTFCSSPAP